MTKFLNIKLLLGVGVLLLFSEAASGQEKLKISINDAVHRGWERSYQLQRSAEELKQAGYEVSVAENKQYPDFTVSGQYMYLNKPKLNNKISGEESNDGGTSPKVHNFAVGQANLSLPVFSGFRIKHGIQLAKKREQATRFKTKNDREVLAVQIIHGYVQLYKANQKAHLIQENLKSARQRVKDFAALEKNELVPLNDLLKVKLQAHQIELRLAKAQKEARMLNYQLVTLLRLPGNTVLEVDTLSFGVPGFQKDRFSLLDRADVKALAAKQEAAHKAVEVEKGGYYPSLRLTGGYLALNLENTISVHRAFNVGVGVAYNFADLFKNKSKVRIAQSRAQSANMELEETMDQAKVEHINALEDYDLAIENYQIYQEAREQAHENYRIVKDKFDNGLSNTRDLLEADVLRLESKINMINGKAEIAEKYYDLKKTEGQLAEEFKN